MTKAPSLLLCVVLSLAASQALAQSVTHWNCWLDTQGDIGIRCLRESDPVLEDDGAAPREAYDDARMQGEFLAGGKPRNVTRAVREAPQRHRDIVWTIPLYSMPFDNSDIELLARAVMCGSDSNCTLQFDRRAHQVAGN